MSETNDLGPRPENERDPLANHLVVRMAEIDAELDTREIAQDRRLALLKEQHQILTILNEQDILDLAQYRLAVDELQRPLDFQVEYIRQQQKLYRNNL